MSVPCRASITPGLPLVDLVGRPVMAVLDMDLHQRVRVVVQPESVVERVVDRAVKLDEDVEVARSRAVVIARTARVPSLSGSFGRDRPAAASREDLLRAGAGRRRGDRCFIAAAPCKCFPRNNHPHYVDGQR